MAIKANASSTGGDFKKFVGVGSFRVLGVNPTKAELDNFYGRDTQEPAPYVTDKVDNEGKSYKQVRVTFMIQADLNFENGKVNKTNAKLKEPYKTTVSFFLDSRYFYNKDKSKVQVIDKYGRTAWVPVDMVKNHQIPVYSNGPAKLDPDYKPCLRGEEELTEFILNYLNVTPIESYNSNTGQWIPCPHPEDAEGNLYKIQDYFKGDFSELKEYCSMIPTNRVKLLCGIRTNNEGRQYSTVYARKSLRNGSNSYIVFKKSIDDSKAAGGLSDSIFSDDSAGVIQEIHEYQETVQATDLSKPVDPFADDDLPFAAADNDDPFADMA